MENDVKMNLLEWIGQSQTAFDIIVCKRDQLRGDFEVLDTAAVDQALRSTHSNRVGAIPLHKAQHALQLTSHRVAHRIARSHASKLDVPVNGLRNAWFHPIFAELATLVPLRHMARKLAMQNAGQSFAIPLETQSFYALNSWSKNDLEPLYLAFELRRRKVPVVLFIEDNAAADLQFGLSKTWLPKGYPQILRNREFTTVMCKRAMRRAPFVSEKVGAKLRHKPGLFTLQRYFGIDRNPTKLSLNLQHGPQFGDIQSFSAPADTPSLIQGFVELMGPLTQKVALWYRSELGSHSIQHAHLADHASFEGGLLAGEVTRNGGQVVIWPHSANLVHMQVHEPKDVAQVTVAAQSTGLHWAKTFHNGKVAIDVRSLLPETSNAPPFEENRPLHVILFAGSHVLKRMPLVDYEQHRATWSTVLRDLHNSDVELTIKHKSSWETREWITSLAPKDAQLRFSNTRANKLKLPNMIFLSISMTSTAIFEGIARGIPGMTVRDSPIDETPYYDPKFVPCVSSNEFVDFVSNLNSAAAMDELCKKQRIWFESETSPNHSIGTSKF